MQPSHRSWSTLEAREPAAVFISFSYSMHVLSAMLEVKVPLFFAQLALTKCSVESYKSGLITLKKITLIYGAPCMFFFIIAMSSFCNDTFQAKFGPNIFCVFSIFPKHKLVLQQVTLYFQATARDFTLFKTMHQFSSILKDSKGDLSCKKFLYSWEQFV